jgi:ubiquinone/menaquinone biosynthesis C-methylase UbiE
MRFARGTYILVYDPLDQQVDFEGIFRPTHEEEVASVVNFLVEVHDQVQGTLCLNFRRLRYINALGVKALAQLVEHARDRGMLTIRLIASAVLAWSERVLPTLCALWERVEFSVYDRNFYKSQGIIEDLEFVPLLRNQTRILWPHEKVVLRQHGLGKGMRVADICCGCGDVPLLIAREFQPAYVLGVDHSAGSIEYARGLQRDFNLHNVDFQRGDATSLMVADDSYDFVLCRLSLQIFSQPELILRELIRIARPGGRVYAICEDYDLIMGYPESEPIHDTYQRAAVYGDHMGMDLRHGKKLYPMFARARLEDIQVTPILVDTVNTDQEAFAHVIESWRQFSVETIGDSLNLDIHDRNTLRAGYDAQLRAIRNPHGYTTWGMIACSGRKPLR